MACIVAHENSSCRHHLRAHVIINILDWKMFLMCPKKGEHKDKVFSSQSLGFLKMGLRYDLSKFLGNTPQILPLHLHPLGLSLSLLLASWLLVFCLSLIVFPKITEHPIPLMKARWTAWCLPDQTKLLGLTSIQAASSPVFFLGPPDCYNPCAPASRDSSYGCRQTIPFHDRPGIFKGCGTVHSHLGNPQSSF